MDVALVSAMLPPDFLSPACQLASYPFPLSIASPSIAKTKWDERHFGETSAGKLGSKGDTLRTTDGTGHGSSPQRSPVDSSILSPFCLYLCVYMHTCVPFNAYLRMRVCVGPCPNRHSCASLDDAVRNRPSSRIGL